MAKKNNIEVQGITISITQIDNSDYISLTDIAHAKSDEPKEVISNWMRLKNSIQYLYCLFW